ncbi:MAG: HutP family protein [Candidatus Wallbacteria bacterium]|nr:HutP family protein [Candidatus Wallbacteria bacterium]
MSETRLRINNLVLNEKGELSLVKIAVCLATIEDQADEEIVEYFKSLGFRCVITRAGGRGDNFKFKLFRNILAAAENSEVISRNPENEYTVYRSVENIVKQFRDEMETICGGGAKIGIVSQGTHLAIGVYGSVGIPGLNVDREILGTDIQYYSLKL